MATPEHAGPAPSMAARPQRAPETFFKAQERNRRATWRMSGLCVFAAFLMGIPLTLVLTPFLYAITMATAEVVNYFSPLPPEFWQTTSDLARLGYRVTEAVINQRGVLDPVQLAIVVALIFLPGIVIALMLWAGMLLLFRHGGVGGTLASLNAREPNQGDLKELQLADAVQEMAIAAGLPAPKVMLIDSPGANAAAIGTSAEDAHLVLCRRLLDDLNREQLQALVGHLVASVGNGDLRIAFTVTSVFETCGLIVTLINAPFGQQSRHTLWRMLGYVIRRGPGKAAAAEEVAELLADTLEMGSTDIERFFNSSRPGMIRKFLRFIFFPFLFTNAAVELTLWFFLNVLLGPCMALLWRTRRYLADAGAVELTRNPDALAGALQSLSEDTTAVAGGNWASHLFVVNPTGDASLRGDTPSGEQQRKFLEAWRAAAGGSMAATPPTTTATAPADFASARREMMSLAMAAAMGDADAVTRLQTFAGAMGMDPAVLHNLPNLNDLMLAQRGDRAALARVRMQRQSRQRQQGETRSGRTGLQQVSFVSFHPPLNKRAKRLQRMGARLVAPSRHGGIGTRIVIAVLYLILGPLLLAAGVMMLFVVAMMIGLNLLFLALWLAVIHWAFAQDWPAIFNGFMKFVQDVSAAFNQRR
ncbi:MAG TPA: M48 family metalloprotease [Terriglobales bacterium]|nr:M48 family metalloprotease [Terriglobales bacterium]